MKFVFDKFSNVGFLKRIWQIMQICLTLLKVVRFTQNVRNLDLRYFKRK